MITQYPHIATVVLTYDAGTNEKGYPLPPVENLITLICRAEPNSSNAIIYTADGKAYNFSYVVYIKLGQQDIPVGARVVRIEIAGTSQTIFTDDSHPIGTDSSISLGTDNINAPLAIGTVKMYSRGQFNQKLWL